MDAASDPDQTTQDKALLRAQMSARAAAIPAKVRETATAQMQRRLLDAPEIIAARGVLVCLSYGIEPETRPLIQALVDAGKQVYLPRADRRDRQLHVHSWPCELHTLSFGLEQPSRSSASLDAGELPRAIDVAVILGLAFDHHGVRLGHGSGYVDRFLAAHPLFSIGLTFETQVVEQLPRASHDVPMSMVVSEDRIVRMPVDAKADLRRWLARDHEEIGAFLDAAIADPDHFDTEAYASFRERLLRHIGIEERILFPAVKRANEAQLPERIRALRVDHAALTTLLVPSPDRALALEIASLLDPHNLVEEQPQGVYDLCLSLLDHELAHTILHNARTRQPVPTTGYFDGRGTVRSAAEALAKAQRVRRA